MSKEIGFKALRRRAYLSYHQDGIIDLLVGWMICLFGIYLLLDSSAFVFLAWLPLLFYAPIKNRLTIPRLGYAKFNEAYAKKRQTRLGLLAALLLFAAVLVIGVLVLSRRDGTISVKSLTGNGMLVYGTVTTLGLLLFGLLSGIWRMAAYGLLCAILMTAGMLASLPGFLLFIILGLAILLTGATMLIRFMRKYPLEHKGAKHDIG